MLRRVYNGQDKKEYARLGLDTDKSQLFAHQGLLEYSTDLGRDKTYKNKFLYTNRYIDRVELDGRVFLRLAKEKGIEIKRKYSYKESLTQIPAFLVTSDDESLRLMIS